jgi:hypothetical protein
VPKSLPTKFTFTPEVFSHSAIGPLKVALRALSTQTVKVVVAAMAGVLTEISEKAAKVATAAAMLLLRIFICYLSNYVVEGLAIKSFRFEASLYGAVGYA